MSTAGNKAKKASGSFGSVKLHHIRCNLDITEWLDLVGSLLCNYD